MNTATTVTKKNRQAEAKARGEKTFIWNENEYYTSNGREVVAQAKYYAEHRAEIRVRQAEHYAKNRTEIRVRHAKYQRSPQGKTAKAKSAAKVRATALTILGGRCVWTGTTTDLQVDHIRPLYRRRKTGYSYSGHCLNLWIVKHPMQARERLQLLCADANNFKDTRDNEESKAAGFAMQRQTLIELEAA